MAITELFNDENYICLKGSDIHRKKTDIIVYINGIPVVVLEFKSAVKKNTTITDAYNQLTIRYKRDIAELFKYNSFVV